MSRLATFVMVDLVTTTILLTSSPFRFLQHQMRYSVQSPPFFPQIFLVRLTTAMQPLWNASWTYSSGYSEKSLRTYLCFVAVTSFSPPIKRHPSAPLRKALQAIVSDLRNMTRDNELKKLLKQRGGPYITLNGRDDSVIVNLYTSVHPLQILTDKRGISIEVTMDTPPGSARHSTEAKRVEFWRGISRKRLMQGSLIGLIWEAGGRIELFFGLISSSADDLIAYAKQSKNHLRLRLNFFGSAIIPLVLEWLELGRRERKSRRIVMVEAPVMYESIRPFLQALQREPTSFPFSRYLVHHTEAHSLQNMRINPPQYTINRPDFRWNLSSLFDNNHPPVFLNPHNEASLDLARDYLHRASRLDVSQADAMIDSLSKEFCLIQGPPGTGKVRT
jgi:hypothetical protein